MQLVNEILWGEGYPTSIQLVAAWLDGWRGRGITNQYLTGCWLGVCGGGRGGYPTNIHIIVVLVNGKGVFQKYPTGFWLGGVGGTLTISKCFLVGWRGDNLSVCHWLMIVGWEVPY